MAEVFWGSLPFLVPLTAAVPGDHLLAGRDPLPAREAGAVTAGAARRSWLSGLIGHGVGPSLTPELHEREAERQGLRYVYKVIDQPDGSVDAERLQRLLAAAVELGFDGLNVTHPVKQAMVPLVDEVVAGRGRDRRAQHGPDPRRPDRRAQHRRHRLPAVVRRRAAGRRPRPRRAARGRWRRHRGRARARRPRACDGCSSSTPTAPAAERARGVAGRRRDARSSSSRPPPTGSPRRGRQRRPGQRHARSGWPPTRARRCRRSCCGRTCGWPTSSTARSTPRCSTAARRAGCTVLSGAGMAVHQAADAFELITGLPADRAAMLRDFDELVAVEAAAREPARDTTGERNR